MNADTKLVLDYPLPVWRMHQPSPYCVPVYQQKWKAHTEPDGATGYVWIDVK
ncbi:hypothetical protein SB379_19845 [Burkholderia multivorans]|uniref:hypothetical protein n=1 Tax=Burkholderia multivorans TaxID=87883 RepID=UPI002B248F30|nr:hypothetical protein [Burkholderia multivorans]MEB2511288.1 hypothetical protein [Burkholderia multivorans]MEB2523729.1 hypothetical protein [Burkholderia multivorans]MEB2575658.1 hypothetical protein [Burkholderia multivorans]MEB2592421.1 hypothetical protein [Burkholderia multivorans]